VIDRRQHPRAAGPRETLRDLAFDAKRQMVALCNLTERLTDEEAAALLDRLTKVGAVVAGPTGPRLASASVVGYATRRVVGAAYVPDPREAGPGLAPVRITFDRSTTPR
jgi:hypothetical protein